MKKNNIKRGLKCNSGIQCTQKEIKPAKGRTKVTKEQMKPAKRKATTSKEE